MLSITGFVFVNNLASGRKFGTRKNRTIVLIENQDGLYVVLVKMSPNEVKLTYMLKDLKGVTYHDKKVVLQFRHPKHDVLVMTDDIDTAKKFKEDLISLAKSQNLQIEELFPQSVLNHFGSIVGCRTFQFMDVSTLRMIALENCFLPNLPEGLGNLTISSLSLNGSKLNIPTSGINTVWNWMTKSKISTSLNVLEMNSMGLDRLPFEIVYLKRIQTLSVSNNKLKYIPHFISLLRELKTLFIDGNIMRFLPESLWDIVFRKINISNNNFDDYEPVEHENSNIFQVPTLLDLSSLTLLNNEVKYIKDDIPFTLWTCPNLIGRCRLCKKLMLLNRNFEQFFYAMPRTEKMIQIEAIYWQYFECRPSCLGS